jgi:hypothetical protein
MSEQLAVCKALGALFNKHGEPSEVEVTFVANAAMELGLTAEQNEAVMGVLKDGGDYGALLGEIKSKAPRTYLFRRVVAATLIDEQIEDDELAVIHETAEAFGFDKDVVGQYLEWMKEGIAWEKRGAELMAKL